MKITEQKLTPQTRDIIDESIEKTETKRGIKLRAHRMITKSYRVLHKSYLRLYDSNIRSFLNAKPFYINRPTVKETKMCICSKYLNPHCLYKALTSSFDILLKSLSEYICKNFVVHVNMKLIFTNLTVFLGKV